MRKITQEDVHSLSALSGLKLSDDEITAMTDDIDNIVRYVEKLESLDTTQVEPTYQVTPIENAYRDDVAVESTISRESLLSLAPESQNHHVKVPKVL